MVFIVRFGRAMGLTQVSDPMRSVSNCYVILTLHPQARKLLVNCLAYITGVGRARFPRFFEETNAEIWTEPCCHVFLTFVASVYCDGYPINDGGDAEDELHSSVAGILDARIKR